MSILTPECEYSKHTLRGRTERADRIVIFTSMLHLCCGVSRLCGITQAYCRECWERRNSTPMVQCSRCGLRKPNSADIRAVVLL